MTDQTERFTISGRVQGVFYRKWAQSNAKGLGLRGFVRNMSDGSVEAVLSGPQERLDAFAAACSAGPPNAEVDQVARAAARAADLPGGQGVDIADDG